MPIIYLHIETLNSNFIEHPDFRRIFVSSSSDDLRLGWFNEPVYINNRPILK
jgi:hypothetical protein